MEPSWRGGIHLDHVPSLLVSSSCPLTSILAYFDAVSVTKFTLSINMCGAVGPVCQHTRTLRSRQLLTADLGVRWQEFSRIFHGI